MTVKSSGEFKILITELTPRNDKYRKEADKSVKKLLILEFPAPKKLTTRNAVRDKQTILSPFIELTN